MRLRSPDPPDPTTDDDWLAYQRAVQVLHGLISPDHGAQGSAGDVRARQLRRFDRFRRFMSAIGDPQDRFRVVHVTGTSGKGSTATMVARILSAAGHRTGLVTSPHLQSATERIQVDGRLIAGRALLHEVATAMDAGEAWLRAHGEPGQLTYGETLVAAAFSHLAREGVEFAVVEVAAGGRFDLTNVVRSEVAVITSVGADHLATLGPTLRDVAWHKSGIINPGAQVVSGIADPVLLDVVADEAERVGARVVPREAGDGFEAVPGPPGAFQRENRRTALTAVQALRRNGVAIPEKAVAHGLAAAQLPGRFEWLATAADQPVSVLLDGAHNSDKMAALAHSLPVPSRPADRPVVVLGLIGSKDAASVAAAVAPVAGALVATEPRVLGKSAHPAARVAEIVREQGFAGEIAQAADPNLAVDLALGIAEQRGVPVVVTGSLYLVGNVRERWFPAETIVRQRTTWPATWSRATGGHSRSVRAPSR